MVVSGETLYHIGLRRSEGAAYCLLTGDPGRVETVAQYLRIRALSHKTGSM